MIQKALHERKRPSNTSPRALKTGNVAGNATERTEGPTFAPLYSHQSVEVPSVVSFRRSISDNKEEIQGANIVAAEVIAPLWNNLSWTSCVLNVPKRD